MDSDSGDEDNGNAGDVQTGSIRLDKWLWYSRIVKSRTLAAKLIADGRARLNRERIEKPSQLVKVDDVVTLAAGGCVRILRVKGLGRRRGPPAEAQTLYVDLTPPPQPEAADPRSQAGERSRGAGRPTKRERRQIERLQGREE
jgi:ribosome-associated heat shock protein Hsp15